MFFFYLANYVRIWKNTPEKVNSRTFTIGSLDGGNLLIHRALSSSKRRGSGVKVPLYLRVTSPKYLQKQPLFGYSMISSIVEQKSFTL